MRRSNAWAALSFPAGTAYGVLIATGPAWVIWVALVVGLAVCLYLGWDLLRHMRRTRALLADWQKALDVWTASKEHRDA